MNVLVSALRLINLVCSGVVIGVFVIEYLLILPLVKFLGVSDGPKIMRFLGPIAWRYMPILGAASWVSAILILIFDREIVQASGILLVIGTALMFFGLFITLRIYGPSEQRVQNSPADTPLLEFHDRLRSLKRVHLVRLSVYVVGFLAYALSVIVK